jgi:hypothetical protein
MKSVWSSAARSFARSVSALALTATAACTFGSGVGSVTGQLDVPNCWSGNFDLQPDFFAGIPYRTEYLFRIQRTGDFSNFADGVAIHVTDINSVRRQLGHSLSVGLPPGVSPPGVPIMADPDPPLVNLTLYLGRSCRSETLALYAVKTALANADGSCSIAAPMTCGANAQVPVGSKLASSTITFTHIFNGNPEEPNAQERLTEGTFDVYLVDPRDVCPGGLGAPARCRGHLTGTFKFFFQRGRPAQPFP